MVLISYGENNTGSHCMMLQGFNYKTGYFRVSDPRGAVIEIPPADLQGVYRMNK